MRLRQTVFKTPFLGGTFSIQGSQNGGWSISGEDRPLSRPFITNDLQVVIGISPRYHPPVVYYVDKLPTARQASG